MPPFIPSKSFRSTCICSCMPSLAEIEAGACRGDHCLAYVLQEAANVGGTSLFFFCCSKMHIAVSQGIYIVLLLHNIASFSQIFEKVGAPHGSGVLLLAVGEALIKPDVVDIREELGITVPTLALCPGAAQDLDGHARPQGTAWTLRDGGEPIDSSSPGCSTRLPGRHFRGRCLRPRSRYRRGSSVFCIKYNYPIPFISCNSL